MLHHERKYKKSLQFEPGTTDANKDIFKRQ